MKIIRISWLILYLLNVVFTVRLAMVGDPHGIVAFGVFVISLVVLFLTLILGFFSVFGSKIIVIYGVGVIVLLVLFFAYRGSDHYSNRYPDLKRNRTHSI
jgi:uncharacterized membrane protein